MSDPVVRRADGSWLYMLPSAIDDAEMAISHVVRGEDHVSNTALQLQMFAALGAAPPAFAHEALLTGSEGKLSKRSEEHTSELQSLMRISYAVFCLKKKKKDTKITKGHEKEEAQTTQGY